MKNIIIKTIGVISLIVFISILIVVYINKEQSKNEEIVKPISNIENQNTISTELIGQEKEDNIEMQQEIKIEEVNNVAQTETKKNNTEKVKQETNSETKKDNTEKVKNQTNSEIKKVNQANKIETKVENKQVQKQDKKTENKEKVEEIEKSKQTAVNEKLANTTYRKVNNEVVPEIINILNDEISKHEELKKYETKAIKGNKEQVYNNTKGFTYMFVKNLEKGKVSGNYTVFKERVKNTVGAFGKYFVYAEDEYVYDSTGSKAYWSQTLVWIYITF